MREAIQPVLARLATAAALGGLLAMPSTPTRAAPSPAQFLEALTAPGPSPGDGRNGDLYDGLIGDWDAEVVDRLPDGTERRQSAEMHFVRVLEGRAVQDLWIVPAIRERGSTKKPEKGNRYGTTLRVYDAKLDVWRVTWWNPVTGAENHLVGRRVGSQIVQTGSDGDGRLIRWVFDHVGPDTFHWKGERSEDGGQTWVCDTEFSARRRPAKARASTGT